MLGKSEVVVVEAAEAAEAAVVAAEAVAVEAAEAAEAAEASETRRDETRRELDALSPYQLAVGEPTRPYTRNRRR